MDSRLQELGALLSRFDELDADAVSRVLKYYGLVLEENERQNLTRLVSPLDFLEGHVADTIELKRSGLLGEPALDLGSGAGVPGLLYASCFGGQWILSESEKRKAEFLGHAIASLGLSRVTVIADRAEAYLGRNQVDSVVVRAVGPVERIYGWIRNCSTWNNLILLKGPRWEGEWEEFQAGRHRRELSIAAQHPYQVRPDQGIRRIIQLKRSSNG